MVTIVSEGLLPPTTLTQRQQVLLQRYEPTIRTATDITTDRKTNFILTDVKLSVSSNSIRAYLLALYSLYFTEPVELKIRTCNRNPPLSPFEAGSIGLGDDYFLR